ncbi:hypothetical protein C0J52_03238 [Blattella germanica]|nr:hypothetical protein C0J52_03238 [Blattella germanica]
MYRQFVVAALLLLGCQGAPNNNTIKFARDVKIVNGDYAYAGEFPFQGVAGVKPPPPDMVRETWDAKTLGSDYIMIHWDELG